MSNKLYLSNGMYTIVDPQDFLYFKNSPCHAGSYIRKDGSIRWFAWYRDSNGITTNLGRAIIINQGIIIGKLHVDHKDGNGLNNLRSNLRVATVGQNASNRDMNHYNKSGYKGVSWCTSRNKWRAYISYKDKTINLGSFNLAVSAAIKYNEFAKFYFGQFAWLNIIPEPPYIGPHEQNCGCYKCQ